MNKVVTATSAAVLSVLVAGSVTSTAFAWHPKGQIVKKVENVTTGGSASDANTAAAAVSAKPGDILQYTVLVSNVGEANKNNTNDMVSTVMVDSLPAGVELVDTPGVRVITAQLGTIKPGASATKTYKVKVTETTDGKIIENKACYAGDSAVKDAPQSGCDVANIKISNPAPEPTPEPTPEPEPETPADSGNEEQPVEELPSVGVGIIAPITAAATAVGGFAVNTLRLKKRNIKR